jgi:DNA-binding LacI/PurR family transcriptional regulator
MNNRLAKISGTSKAGRMTARRHVAAVLSQEILDNPTTTAFPIESEHQLCRRFSVSRVTVRLVLADLEHRGLIYRKHGKGTFAHGRSARIHRHIAVLMKAPMPTENRPLAEFLRGLHTFVCPLRSTIILISQSPEEWRPELAGVLSGVVVVAENTTAHDLDNLGNRGLPFLIIGETDLPGPRVDLDRETGGQNFFVLGQRAAEALNRAFLTGAPVDNNCLDGLYDFDVGQLNQIRAKVN